MADTLSDVARLVGRLWMELDPAALAAVRRYDVDLFNALHQLTVLVVSETEPVKPVEAPREYPAEMRVTDLENALKAQHRRGDALHQARKSWGGTMSEDADRHARNITTIAQAFDRFLADGTAHEMPDAPQEGGNADLEPPYGPTVREGRNGIIKAALAWVDRAHLKNPMGPENWRNWSDDHDQDLIDAVLAYKGLPPLERKKL